MPSRFRRRSSRRRPAAAGFSLIEMLVAVAIVGLLIGVVGPAAMRQLQSSRVTTAEAQITQLRSALDIFLIEVGRYPTEQEGLNALINGAGTIPGWNGPYLRDGNLPADPWGGTFLYSLDQGQVRITSLGADGQPGGTGVDADVEG
ncbi:type II secretion system major pseudopilin GspG [Cognatiyoonia sp. IB215182]|uniref:type II secretion system major pseudopilin GspG n=1 Tax=Cognatiyoonia sp. IB215182 TaxID=3097353 RepID=UPI002A0C88C9|nr:type II secretion system major pseudopilin GspG [Cognatiyoonia sp. IB215182]MDX8353212.1 type II secretion system major pseudopilin GspG [Cognatiyoonia sp. IB215182]